ncbi:hypothetical protein VTJ83DRAFT_1265 [Remersonia thermophila]|uniref:cyclin-dependent kinase n=1 Tax=Remersonia thermophila TaxID=72144 RepID=A0ABR4DP49_9PEZI
MASKPKSRWADDEADAALEAQRKKEKEEKKRLKAEKARKLEAERKAREAAAASTSQQAGDDPDRGPPAKRRRLSPERDNHDGDDHGDDDHRDDDNEAPRAHAPSSETTAADPSNLLRFEGGTFGRSRSVENYDKLNDIEEGTYGWVSRAKDVATGQVVALKRLKMDPKDRSGVPVTGLREIQILKDCNHGNVVKLLEVVVGDDASKVDSIFLVLEFLEHDLKSILEDMPSPFLASEVKTLLRQLASGLAYLHDHFILHRDLKTSNLLLNNRGRLKIADFGMARYVSDPPPANLTPLVVTLWYRAPELLLGETRYGAAVDMWSVGCVFGELLTREPLLQGRNEVDQLARVFELCGTPSDDAWPGFRRLPHARGLKLPRGPPRRRSAPRSPSSPPPARPCSARSSPSTRPAAPPPARCSSTTTFARTRGPSPRPCSRPSRARPARSGGDGGRPPRRRRAARR